jgi:RNA polymerase sigma factor (sigma-70 family)
MNNFIDKNSRIIQEWDAFIKSGDMSSLEVVYNYYYDPLFNYGRKFHIGSQVIEDSIQNLYVRLINSRKKLGKIDNLPSYLFYSFRNELFHLNTKEKGVPVNDGFPNFFSDQGNDPQEEIIRNEDDANLNIILKKLISKLTPSQQEMLYLRYDAGLSYEGISRVININVESCRTSVYRAIKSLRKGFVSIKHKDVPFYLS